MCVCVCVSCIQGKAELKEHLRRYSSKPYVVRVVQHYANRSFAGALTVLKA